MPTSTIARRSLAASAALALALGLGGCSTIQSIFGGSQAERDEETGQVKEEGQGSAFELNVGDCLDLPSDTEFSDVQLIPCDNPHDAEVMLNYDAAGDATFPGDTVISAEADERCAAEFQTYVGSDPQTSAYYVSYFTPLADGWKGGDRGVTCLAIKPNAAGTDLEKITGSVKGIAQ